MSGFTGKNVHFDDTYLHVELEDGRIISTPMKWYPELEAAPVKVIRDYCFICDGTGIEWPAIDYHLSIEAMLKGPPQPNEITAAAMQELLAGKGHSTESLDCLKEFYSGPNFSNTEIKSFSGQDALDIQKAMRDE
ncbi:DUF2442 domain-containing protein [Marinobacterium sp. MBR-109]|jgi:hypothetical protein|uniref:DUF2442 domain-containing protein n=1 Tax=Marinobacterium sp. MBR-109 TaxID=3156462 RepID=UPI003392268A